MPSNYHKLFQIVKQKLGRPSWPPISSNGAYLNKVEPITTCENPCNYPRLSFGHISGLEAFWALGDFKFDIVALDQ